MRFMLLMYPGPGFDRPFDKLDIPIDVFEDMDTFKKRLSESGKLLSGDGPHPSSNEAGSTRHADGAVSS